MKNTQIHVLLLQVLIIIPQSQDQTDTKVWNVSEKAVA